MPQDPAEDETTRLRRVYGNYASDDAVRSRWDPDQPGNRLILAERDGLLREALDRIRASRVGHEGPCTIVDLGCGEGHVLASIIAPDPDASGVGIDLLERRLHLARAQHPKLPLVAANGTALPLADATVDVMVVFTVFSSILDPSMAGGVAAEVRRVVRPGGRVVWYDLRRDNPRNPEVHGVSAADLAQLFPGWIASLRSCTLLPPLARRAATVSPRSYGVLARVPMLRSHLFGVLRRPGPTEPRVGDR